MADWAVDYSKADDTGAGNSWAAAKKTLKAATDAAAAGDTIYVHVGTDQVVTVDTIWTIAAGVRIFASNDTANFPPTVLSTAGGIISPTAGVDYTLTGGPALISGFRLKPGTGATASVIHIANTDPSFITLENCYLDLSATTNGNSTVTIGYYFVPINDFTNLVNCWFKFGAAGQDIALNGSFSMIGGGLESGSTVPTVLFQNITRYGERFRFLGVNFSGMISGTMFGQPAVGGVVTYTNCLLGAAALNSAQILSGLETFVFDSSSTDTHYHIAHYSFTGSTTVSTTIYANDGAEYNIAGDKCSWVVAGNANTSRANPYISPWIQAYNEATAAITPELEILRDGSATAFTDIEVWSEWSLKTAGGSPIATLYSDYGGHLSTGTAQGNGVGLSGWTGEAGTAWSGRLECPSVTPAEIGHVSARVVVAGNHTVYADPQIRGL